MAIPAPVIVCLTAGGEALAKRIAPTLGAQIHGRAGRTQCDIQFDETTGHLRDLFAAGVPIVGICAAGILIRAVAPLLSDKHTEPPVLALAEDGTAVVPLLGGHHGANALAQEIAKALGIEPSFTTASDVVHGVALDQPPAGWRLKELLGTSKDLAATILAGGNVMVQGDGNFADHLVNKLAANRRGEEQNTSLQGTAEPGDGVTVSVMGDGTQGSSLRYLPIRYTIGVGCARDCPADELAHIVHRAMAEGHVLSTSLAGVFSLDLKADEAAILDLSAKLNVPFRIFTAEDLEKETPRLANPSDVVFAEVGCHGVAEAAALRAAGADADLVVEKRKSANATVAIARAPHPITELLGRARGQVSLIGLGPGRTDWRTPEASRLIAEADELVGYGFYIDLIGPLAKGKQRTDFPLGGEEDRCRHALEQAGKGHNVALICSGDAGIYAMGALVYELMGRGDISDAARRVDVVTAPGVTAMQAAAARVGAPLGHDFCAISLSDLLTPRKDIETRIEAAAKGDFVTAFYNPVSQRRKELFVKAIDTFRTHRPAETPVILARSLGRPDETVEVLDLSEVRVEQVDMMTVVIVGSKQSRRVLVGGCTRVYTPRGYAKKMQELAS